MKAIKLTVACLAASAISCFAATNASDNASNSPYQPGNTWNNGSNGGTGFGAWALSSVGAGGTYLGGSGEGNPSFALFSGSGSAGNSATADRAFTGGALVSGQTFSVIEGNTGLTTGGEIGIQLLSGSTVKWTLKFVGGTSFWQINDGASDYNTAQGWVGSTPVALSFTYNGGNSYSYSFGSASGINYTASSGISNLTGFRFYSSAQGGGENVGFNNISVVPEPSTFALLGIGALGTGLLARRRKA